MMRGVRTVLVVALVSGCGHRAPDPTPDRRVDPRADPRTGPVDERTEDRPDERTDEGDQAEPDAVGLEGDDTIDLDAATHTDRAVLDRALDAYAAMRSSAYSHRTRVDEANGRFDFDCSGFVDYVLAGANPRAFAELRAATTKRPLARHFVEFFESLASSRSSAWRSIARPSELGPGDVIAWLKPADVKSTNTGHVMIVRGPAQFDATRDVWTVPIIDSTSVPHGKGDSRKSSRTTGLGIGEVLLVVDQHGTPIGYRWSRGKKAKVHMTTIALARVRG